jgi:hypothetical protein
MVDDIRIAALSAKMGVLSISDDLQIALVKTDDGWSGGPQREGLGLLPVTARCWGLMI